MYLMPFMGNIYIHILWSSSSECHFCINKYTKPIQYSISWCNKMYKTCIKHLDIVLNQLYSLKTHTVFFRFERNSFHCLSLLWRACSSIVLTRIYFLKLWKMLKLWNFKIQKFGILFFLFQKNLPCTIVHFSKIRQSSKSRVQLIQISQVLL